MSKDAEKIQYDDHCCCLAQNNKDNGPKRRDSVQEAINAGSSLTGCCGLQGCECCGLCYPSMHEKDGDMAVYGTTPCLKTFCTMVKVHYTKDTVKKCTPYTNPVEWPGWLKFCCTSGSANMFSVAAGMLDGALILYKGSWIKQGCRSYGCCGLKGCCFGGYKCMCTMATMGSLELGEECFEDTDCVPPAMNPKSLMWDIEDDAAIGAKLVRRNSISNTSETGRSDLNDKKVEPKYGAPFGKRRTGPDVTCDSCVKKPLKALVCGFCNEEADGAGCCTKKSVKLQINQKNQEMAKKRMERNEPGSYEILLAERRGKKGGLLSCFPCCKAPTIIEQPGKEVTYHETKN